MNTPKKPRNYAGLAVLLVFVMAAIPSVLPSILYDKPANKIIKTITDKRGLTSVVYMQDGREYALDYLTPLELDSLKIALK